MFHHLLKICVLKSNYFCIYSILFSFFLQNIQISSPFFIILSPSLKTEPSVVSQPKDPRSEPVRTKDAAEELIYTTALQLGLHPVQMHHNIARSRQEYEAYLAKRWTALRELPDEGLAMDLNRFANSKGFIYQPGKVLDLSRWFGQMIPPDQESLVQAFLQNQITTPLGIQFQDLWRPVPKLHGTLAAEQLWTPDKIGQLSEENINRIQDKTQLLQLARRWMPFFVWCSPCVYSLEYLFLTLGYDVVAFVTNLGEEVTTIRETMKPHIQDPERQWKGNPLSGSIEHMMHLTLGYAQHTQLNPSTIRKIAAQIQLINTKIKEGSLPRIIFTIPQIAWTVFVNKAMKYPLEEIAQTCPCYLCGGQTLYQRWREIQQSQEEKPFDLAELYTSVQKIVYCIEHFQVSEQSIELCVKLFSDWELFLKGYAWDNAPYGKLTMEEIQKGKKILAQQYNVHLYMPSLPQGALLHTVQENLLVTPPVALPLLANPKLPSFLHDLQATHHTLQAQN